MLDVQLLLSTKLFINWVEHWERLNYIICITCNNWLKTLSNGLET